MFTKKRNVFTRLITFLLVFSVTSMGFPGMLFASDYSKLTGTNTTTTPSNIINIFKNYRSSTQLIVDPVVNTFIKNDAIPLTDITSKSPHPQVNKDDAFCNGLIVKN